MTIAEKNKRPAKKVVWYFPIIPHLKRLFANEKTAELMRWHAKKRVNDGKLRQLADGSQWRAINSRYKGFNNEIRNVRFGLSTDRMNPFNTVSTNHNTWTVTLCIYNLLPWLCMKWTHLMMPILIHGPRQPRNDIDVFL